MKIYRLIVLYSDKTYEWFDFGSLHNVGEAVKELSDKEEQGGKIVVSGQMITLDDVID